MRRALLPLILTLVLTAASTAATTPTSVTPGFVKRSGTTLTLNSKPYRFAGINIYMAASGDTASSCGGKLYPDVSVPLSHMPSGVVVRFWAFQNFFVSKGSFDWTHFDKVLAIASAHGTKVIPVLANQYGYCEKAKNLAWYQRAYRTSVESGDLVTYKRYARAAVSRYRNDPTIAMWQLVNEAQPLRTGGTCDERAALAAERSFADDVGGMVHSLDPNHLVSLGAIVGWSPVPHVQWCGTANSDFKTLMASPGIDVCDYHDYGYPTEPLGVPFAPNLTTAIQMCRAVKKPIMVGETGIYAKSDAALAPRAEQFRAKFSAQFGQGVVGILMWTWAVQRAYVYRSADPNYGIFPGDPSLAVLRWGVQVAAGRPAGD